MRKRTAGCVLAALSPLWVVACGKSAAAPSVSFTSPLASQPANGASIKFSQQPVTLTITNAVRTGATTPTYSVEVATDSGFANKVFTKDGIAEGSGGTTSVQLNPLAGSTTYYWRSKAALDGVTGQPSPALSFFMQPNVVINSPTNGNPADGGAASDARPTFTVTDATVTGQAGSLFYEFQVATSPSFSNILVTSPAVPEQPGNTSWTSTIDLAAGTYAWRARATDPQNGVVGAYTNPAQFTLVPFDMRKAVIWDNPPDLGSWAETANITMVDLSSGRIVVDFDKRQGPGEWPDVGFGDGSIEYTLGICLNINGTWNCSAPIQFWNGRDLAAGGDVGNLAGEWFYDSRWGALQGHQPAPGETVGWFVAAGNLRDIGNVITKERSKVLFLPYGQNFGTLAAAKKR
jgi:hypothetical protein